MIDGDRGRRAPSRPSAGRGGASRSTGHRVRERWRVDAGPGMRRRGRCGRGPVSCARVHAARMVVARPRDGRGAVVPRDGGLLRRRPGRHLAPRCGRRRPDRRIRRWRPDRGTRPASSPRCVEVEVAGSSRAAISPPAARLGAVSISGGGGAGLGGGRGRRRGVRRRLGRAATRSSLIDVRRRQRPRAPSPTAGRLRPREHPARRRRPARSSPTGPAHVTAVDVATGRRRWQADARLPDPGRHSRSSAAGVVRARGLDRPGPGAARSADGRRAAPVDERGLARSALVADPAGTLVVTLRRGRRRRAPRRRSVPTGPERLGARVGVTRPLHCSVEPGQSTPERCTPVNPEVVPTVSIRSALARAEDRT